MANEGKNMNGSRVCNKGGKENRKEKGRDRKGDRGIERELKGR
jgi:hypothetical protein